MGKVSKALEKAGFMDGESDVESPSKSDNEIEESQKSSYFNDDPFDSGRETATFWDERLEAVNAPSSPLLESFRRVRSRILYPDEGSTPPRTILVTSATFSEGKSFVAANLGIVIAQGVDRHAMLIGCDFRNPALAKLFAISGRYGLSDYLQSDRTLDELIQPTSIERLSLLPAGQPPGNPAELLGSEKMIDLVDQMSSRYDDRLIVFDSPPMQAVSETLVLSKHVDGVVLVVRWGRSSRIELRRLVESIGRKKIIGVVFNGFQSNFINSRYFSNESREKHIPQH